MKNIFRRPPLPVTAPAHAFPCPWPDRLDTAGAFSAAALPMALVVGSTAFEAALAAGILSWLIRSAMVGPAAFRKTFSHPLAPPLLAWYGAMMVSLLTNGPGSKGAWHDVAIVRFCLFIPAVIDISSRKPLTRWLVHGFSVAVAFAAVNTVAAYAMGHDLIGNPLARYTGKLREAARIAANSAYAIPLFLGWAISDRTHDTGKRMLIAGIGGVAIAQLLQTRIRTAMLAALLGMFFLIVIRLRRHVRPWILWACCLAVVVLGVVFFEKSGTWSLASMYDRIYFWKVAWAMFQDHPLVGVGVSSWPDAYQEIAASGRIEAFVGMDGTIWQRERVLHAHNLLLALLSTTGILGTALFGWLFTVICRQAARRPFGVRTGMITWPVVMLGIGMTGSNIYSSSYLALFALIVVTLSVQNGECPAATNNPDPPGSQ